MLPGVPLGIPLLSIAVLLPIALSPFTHLLGGKTSWRVSALLCHISTFIPLVIILSFLPQNLQGAIFHEEYRWIPLFNVEIGFVLDGLSYPFAFLITLVGFLASIYSYGYMEKEHQKHAYFMLLQMFITGMLGAVLSSNLIIFFLFWELMLIPSYFLIAYWGTGNPRVIGYKYFIFTHMGALSILLGIAWLFNITGNLNIFDNIATAGNIPYDLARYVTILFFIGFAVKMAIFPVHTWLPDAHAEAPTPISVLLSGVMIKTGIYAYLRIILGIFQPVSVELSLIIATLAVISMIWGGVMALMQTDIKRLLAYSSISQIGYILFGTVSSSVIGVTGGIFHVLNHGFAKGLLFMSSGVLIRSVNERNLGRLGGLAAKLPLTSTAMLVAGLSIAGTPPLGGFASEWMVFSGGFESGRTLLTSVAVIATVLTVGYYLRMVRSIFFGESRSEHMRVQEAAPSMIGPMAVLLTLVIILGFLHAPILTIINNAVATILKA